MDFLDVLFLFRRWRRGKLHETSRLVFVDLSQETLIGQDRTELDGKEGLALATSGRVHRFDFDQGKSGVLQRPILQTED